MFWTIAKLQTVRKNEYIQKPAIGKCERMALIEWRRLSLAKKHFARHTTTLVDDT
jgi:hypothetical protein